MISSKRVKKFFRHFIFIENGVRWVKRQLWCLFCRAIRTGKINAYLRAHPVRKLQIGAGHAALDDWLNTDFSPKDSRFVYLDACRRFPFPDDSFDYIFCEHLIEHLSFPEARYMMGECFRVLKPGGKIRVSTPDLDVVMGFLAREKTGIQERYIEFAFRRWIS
ncbi:MAG: methyltransferase domain-containing protein, partial [bacterium]|nr:methyltransferase domain-containing protein [bacterium]